MVALGETESVIGGIQFSLSLDGWPKEFISNECSRAASYEMNGPLHTHYICQSMISAPLTCDAPL